MWDTTYKKKLVLVAVVLILANGMGGANSMKLCVVASHECCCSNPPATDQESFLASLPCETPCRYICITITGQKPALEVQPGPAKVGHKSSAYHDGNNVLLFPSLQRIAPTSLQARSSPQGIPSLHDVLRI